MNLEILKYPIGRFEKPANISESNISCWREVIASLPARLRSEVDHLNQEQLDMPYRPDGWTIRQVVHHLADSHMNAIIRLKLTWTESPATIRPYREDLWAELADSKNFDISSSLQILEGVHTRWVQLLHHLKEEDWNKYYIHPEYKTEYRLNEMTALYAWHCNHHLAHITSCKERENWS